VKILINVAGEKEKGKPQCNLPKRTKSEKETRGEVSSGAPRLRRTKETWGNFFRREKGDKKARRLWGVKKRKGSLALVDV